jgi:hypothetical protein
LKKPSPAVIARRIERHPATVKWHMLRNGLLTQQPGYLKTPYSINGVVRTPWSPEQDARLVELRVAGKSYREIAEILSAEFAITRKLHSCQVRDVMLAAAPD